jgi:hypothetical protein
MKYYPSFMIVLFMVGILITPGSSVAQRGMKGHGQHSGAGIQSNRLYDVKTVETIKGEVSALDTLLPQKGMRGGIHIMLKTDKETISVHLGPSWFMEKQKVNVKVGDKISVTGSRITYDEKPAIIAAEIKNGETVLKLRDEAGLPLWSKRKQ